jgi:hypothetical protein
MAFAAKYVLKLADEIWACSPVSVALMAATLTDAAPNR